MQEMIAKVLHSDLPADPLAYLRKYDLTTRAGLEQCLLEAAETGDEDLTRDARERLESWERFEAK